MPDPPRTRQEAIAQAQRWGRTLSHTNTMLETEYGPENRTLTLAHIAQADAAEVVRLCALASVLPDEDDVPEVRESVDVNALMRESYVVEVDYTNHRGERRWRRVRPAGVWAGSTEWYPVETMLLTVWDEEKDARRDLAWESIHGWRDLEGHPLASPLPGGWAEMLLERDEVQGREVLKRIVAYYEEFDGRAADFGELHLVKDARSALERSS